MSVRSVTISCFFRFRSRALISSGIVAQEAGRDERVLAVRPQLVAGELLFHELVVGLVVVEGGDDVVAIAPGVGARAVGVVAVAIGIAREVEPAAAPALAVLRRGEQAIDELLVRLRRTILARTPSLLRASARRPRCRAWRGG